MNVNDRGKVRSAFAEVRPFEPDDLLATVEIFTASVRILAGQYYSPDQIAAWAPSIPDLDRWTERLAPLHTIVAQLDAALVGFASYTDEGYLDFLFTRPGFARRGVATQLYLHVEVALAAAGIPKIFTHSSLAARSFFEKQGFRIEAEEKVDCRDILLDRFVMYKILRHADTA